MTIFRTEHKKNYTVVNNFICKDKRLSWKAKGIWLYAFSRPDDWTFNLEDLINQSTDGKDSVSAGLRELEEFGYLQRSRNRDAQGKMIKGAEWVFYETPQAKNESTIQYEPKPENPILDNPVLGFPVLVNPPLLSTEAKTSTEATPIPELKQLVVVVEGKKAFTKDDAFFGANKFRKDWTSDEIEDAYEVLKVSNSEIQDPLAYIEGVINKKRIIKQNKDQSCQKTQKLQPSKNSLETDKPKYLGNAIVEPHSHQLSLKNMLLESGILC